MIYYVSIFSLNFLVYCFSKFFYMFLFIVFLHLLNNFLVFCFSTFFNIFFVYWFSYIISSLLYSKFSFFLFSFPLLCSSASLLLCPSSHCYNSPIVFRFHTSSVPLFAEFITTHEKTSKKTEEERREEKRREKKIWE